MKTLVLMALLTTASYAAPRKDSLNADPYKAVMHWADSMGRVNDDRGWYYQEYNHLRQWGPLSRFLSPTIDNSYDNPFCKPEVLT